MRRVTDPMWRSLVETATAFWGWVSSLSVDPASWSAFTWLIVVGVVLVIVALIARPRRRWRNRPDLLISHGEVVMHDPAGVPSVSLARSAPPHASFELSMTVSNLSARPVQLLELAVRTNRSGVPNSAEVGALVPPHGAVDVTAEVHEMAGDEGYIDLFLYVPSMRPKTFRLRARLRWEPWNVRFKVLPLRQSVEPARELESGRRSRADERRWRRRLAEQEHDRGPDPETTYDQANTRQEGSDPTWVAAPVFVPSEETARPREGRSEPQPPPEPRSEPQPEPQPKSRLESRPETRPDPRPDPDPEPSPVPRPPAAPSPSPARTAPDEGSDAVAGEWSRVTRSRVDLQDEPRWTRDELPAPSAPKHREAPASPTRPPTQASGRPNVAEGSDSGDRHTQRASPAGTDGYPQPELPAGADGYPQRERPAGADGYPQRERPASEGRTGAKLGPWQPGELEERERLERASRSRSQTGLAALGDAARRWVRGAKGDEPDAARPTRHPEPEGAPEHATQRSPQRSPQQPPHGTPQQPQQPTAQRSEAPPAPAGEPHGGPNTTGTPSSAVDRQAHQEPGQRDDLKGWERGWLPSERRSGGSARAREGWPSGGGGEATGGARQDSDAAPDRRPTPDGPATHRSAADDPAELPSPADDRATHRSPADDRAEQPSSTRESAEGPRRPRLEFPDDFS